MDEMKEGFLCPVCKIDLQTMTKLHSHFQEEHSDDLNLKKILLGVKRIIVKQNLEDDGSSKYSSRKEVNSLDIYNTYQEIGKTRSRLKNFEEVRSRRLEGFAAETNKLIIRLDKLLTNLPTEPSRKKMHEQTVVPWIDGEDVSRCPECTKTFHLARRQHHCRLCGSIMCHECSTYLSIIKARIILSCATDDDSKEEELTAENSLRICHYCMNLLESREQMKASRNCNPPIAQLYDQLREYTKELDKDVAMYREMSLTLNEGKSTYNLNDGQKLWDKIMKLSEKIGLLSQKIASLGMNEDPCKLSVKEVQLQKAVSKGVNGYIQTKILSLPSLPSEQIYKQLQERRRRRIEQEIFEDKGKELTEALLSSQVLTERIHYKPKLDRSTNNVTVDEGWIPDTELKVYRNNDPIIEQMNNIRSYIKQAREAYKFDEVASLQEHLKELQEEYYRQQS